MLRRLAGLFVATALVAAAGCGSDDAAAPNRNATDADTGAPTPDAGEMDTLSADARIQPDEAHELTFVMENETGETIYMQKGPGCLHRGPGWVLVESRYRSGAKFLTSTCTSCSCDDPQTGAGCSCDCPESRQKQQTEVKKLPDGESVSWKWTGKVYTRGSGNQCDRAQPPPASRLRARFCWQSGQDSPEQCAPVDFTYVDTGRLTATVEPK